MFATTFLLSIVVLTAVVVGVTPTAFAQHPDSISNPDNGNYYLYVDSPGISWTEANVTADLYRANGIIGHLVAITSSSENDFVANLVPNDSRAWIGLTDETTEGTYQWVNGEPFDYTNWDVNQPDNYNNNEHYGELIGSSGKWNDLPNDSNDVTGFVIEYPISISDIDPILNPDNGHYYEYIDAFDITWTEALTAAENSIYNDISGHLVTIQTATESHTYNGIRGHLVTITSQSENDFVANLVPNDSRAWIGLTDETTEGTYQWVTGEPFDYSDWDVGKPFAGPGKNYVQFLGYNDKWINTTNDPYYTGGYIIEYTPPPVKNPVNGHYYEYVIDDDITWTDAKSAAENSTYDGIRGHLVTITSQSENDFITDLVSDNYNFTWIGLSDEDTEGEYKWVNGETFDYSNWDANQPDNSGGNEHYVQFRGYSDRWNDIKNDADYINGYIIEYTPAILNPDNGHYYQYVIDDDITWTNAKTAAENSIYKEVNGHLVTITSQSENDFVAGLVSDNYNFTWMGLTDEDTEGGFKWITGETSFFANWDANQPDNSGGNEHYVQFRGYSDRWNDIKNDADYINGYIIEYNIPHLNPENGHYYQYITDYFISWPDAKTTAAENFRYKGLNGHLATITSQSENDFIADLLPYDTRPWIGLTDKHSIGDYKWVTGEPFSYSNWWPGEPSNSTIEHYGALYANNGKWNNNEYSSYSTTGYVVEYSP